ncbi:MAG: glutaminase [Synechococcales cyanobacterium T60_A2020_003]|nr:glutaminase [Synechococcales cyanobacterium T60_A2020_003]
MDQGRLPRYIPKLAIACPTWFAAQISTVDDRVYEVGDRTLRFPLMSVIKPFLFLSILEQYGTEQTLTHVGIDPSDQPFNSLDQLQQDQGFPRNPMINSGAIALSALLPGETPAIACQRFQQWLKDQAGCHLDLDLSMLESVRSVPNERNWAIAQALCQSGHLAGSVDDALDIYERVCCLSGTVADLAQLGVLLLRSSDLIQTPHRRMVQAVMLTCGLYEQSCRFAVEVGLPTKSGVSGCMLTLVPGKGAIACYSPPLDAIGNSVAGLDFIRRVVRHCDLSLFA